MMVINSDDCDITSKATELDEPPSNSPPPAVYKFPPPKNIIDSISPARLKYICEELIVLPSPVIAINQSIKDFKRERSFFQFD